MRAACLCLLLLTAAPQRPLTVIPYHAEDGLVFCDVRVNGSSPRTFVLDTGAPHTVVDSAAAVALNLGVLSQDRTRGAGRGTVGRQHLPPLDLELGGVRHHVADPWAIDLAHVGIRHVDGLVGADLFERFVVRIDPDRRTLTLYGAQDSVPPLGTPIPLTLENDRLYVNMRLTLSNGISEVHRMRVDTGSSLQRTSRGGDGDPAPIHADVRRAPPAALSAAQSPPSRPGASSAALSAMACAARRESFGPRTHGRLPGPGCDHRIREAS
jgi:hypothetical protein